MLHCQTIDITIAHSLSCELWHDIILTLSCEGKERAGKSRIGISKALISLSKSPLLGMSWQSVIDTENALFLLGGLSSLYT